MNVNSVVQKKVMVMCLCSHRVVDVAHVAVQGKVMMYRSMQYRGVGVNMLYKGKLWSCVFICAVIEWLILLTSLYEGSDDV